MTPPKTPPAPAPKPSLGRRLLRWMAAAVVALGLLTAVGAVVGAWYYQRHIIEEPGEHIGRAAIMEVIAQESPILYRDGQTRLGVFFGREHREYVHYKEIPRAWVDAIVSVEDQRYWEHPGVDLVGLSRAVYQNIKAGQLVSGGSSLSQQTAKNLYYRTDRSVQSKLTELVNALRLEAHYSKEEILEFYANQFHVNANGRGLGIAARYFFDKEVGELGTLECAFLAGMVKGPANYNPFIGATEEKRRAARQRATVRTRYVLDRMRDEGKLGAAEHARLVQQEIPFRKGHFQYDSNVIVDEVAARLEMAPFPDLFAALGIDNPSTAGIQVVTTIDPVAQREATYALWHHLSELGPALEGSGPQALLRPEVEAPVADPDNPPHAHEVVSARVLGPHAKGVELDLGGQRCVVDKEGLERMASVLVRARKASTRARAEKADIDAMVAELAPGKVVLASQRRQEGLCDLELRPELQGALLLLEKGEIRAMVGGNDNRNFNRAVTARRQLGSTWKTLIYGAALQLKWSPLDALDNRVTGFPFEGSWYWPRADHQSEPFVSLAWAGTRSENIASVWLLYHLLDRLDPAEFKVVAERAGLTRRPGEAGEDWIKRVRDQGGVISTESRLPEMAFTAARLEMLQSGELSEAEQRELMSLQYGRGADNERSKAAGNAARLEALQRNFLAQLELGERCQAQAQKLAQVNEGGGGFRLFRREEVQPSSLSPSEVSDLRMTIEGDGLRLACGGSAGQPIDAEAIRRLAADELELRGEREQMVVNSALPLGRLQELQSRAERRRLVIAQGDLYDLEALQYHPDFRTLVAIRYVSALARRLGVAAELPPVLSLPLGAADISLEEAALMYQGLVTGEVWSFPGERYGESAVPGLTDAEPVGPVAGGTLLIAEIRDRDGQLLYKAQPVAERALDEAEGQMVGDILRNVVLWGTGTRARSVSLGGSPLPVMGKTGTTNAYKNAAFSGFIPRPGAPWGQGYTLVGYVGYDDNRPMARGGIKVAGALGTLPAWVATAQAMADGGLLGAENPPAAALGDGWERVAVSSSSGLPAEGSEASALVQKSSAWIGGGELLREFTPFTAGVVVAPAIQPTGPGAPELPADDQDLREVWVEEMGEAPPAEAPAAPELPAAPEAVAPEPSEGVGLDTDIDPRIAPE